MVRSDTRQLDWVEADSGLPLVSVGHIVETSYGTGPYLITAVSGPCRCPEYVRSLSGDVAPSEPHYHITCEGHNGTAWLNGYLLDGNNVWCADRLLIHSPTEAGVAERI